MGEAFYYLKSLLLDITTIPILDIHEYSHDFENDGDLVVIQNHHTMILDA